MAAGARISSQPGRQSGAGSRPASSASGLWIGTENHKGSNDTTMVLVVRRRQDLLRKIIPFFESNPLLSCKHEEFITFADIVRRMDAGEHLELAGFRQLASRAVHMNGNGRYRRFHRSSESRILRDHMPSATEVWW